MYVLVSEAPPPAAAHVGTPPATVSTCPVVPIANLLAVFVPLSYSISPVVVIGDKALYAAAAVVCPVPPCAMAIVVPFQVPLVMVPTDVNDEVTTVELSVVPVRDPAAAAAGAAHAGTPPETVSTLPVDPIASLEFVVPELE